MRIPSGSTTNKVEFVAYDTSGNTVTGLSSGWTVVSSKGGSITTWTTPTIAEISAGSKPGWYSLLLDEQTTVTQGVGEEELGLLITHSSISPVRFGVQIYEQIYDAQIDFRKDGSTNEYTVRWRRDGVRVTSGITSPQIQVVKRDGTDLVAATNMTQIGATGAYKYDEATNVQDDGEVYEVVVTATIDGATRTDSAPRGRDAT